MVASANPNAGLGRERELPPPTGPKPSMPPKHYRIINCGRQCSLNALKHPSKTAALLHEWYEAGFNNWSIIEKAALLDVKLSHGAVARHRANHLEVYDPDDEPEEEVVAPGQRMSEVEILDRLVQEGSKNLGKKNTKVTPEMMMRAMELKYKLTQGSVLGETFDAIARAMTGGTENPSAMADEDEQEQGAADSAPEVLDE